MRHKSRKPDPFTAYVTTFRASESEYRKALRAARRARKLRDKRWSRGGPFNAGRED